MLIQYYVMDRTQGVLLSDATKTFIGGMAYPQRKFSFITFTDADFPKNLVSDYAEKNKNLFRTVDVSKITVNSEGDAQKVRDEAVKGDKTFADLAKTYSKDQQAETGGAVGVKRYYDLKTEIGKAADLDKLFSLTAGAISPVIAGDKVWTIYKVNAAAADADLTSADTLAVVRAYIVKNERGLLEDNLESQAKEFSAEAKTNFAAAAKKIGKTAQTSDWVALNFGNHDLFPKLTTAKDPVFRGLAANEDFFKQAFKLEAGQVSGPILASPSVLVVHVDAIKTVPEKGDAPVPPTSVDSAVNAERNQVLEKVIFDSPKFEDHFQSVFQGKVQVQ
jgi:parvulin-like peptidyl-prolyl isomerase